MPAIETIQGDFRDEAGLRKRAAEVRRAGFRGMLAIHPAQVDVINEAFTPSAEELASAQEIVDLFAANPGAGAIGYKGAMLDRPHLARAQALLALAAAAMTVDAPTDDVVTDASGLTCGAYLRPGDHIVWGQACGEPTTLVEALIAQAESIGRPLRVRGHQLFGALERGGGGKGQSLQHGRHRRAAHGGRGGAGSASCPVTSARSGR